MAYLKRRKKKAIKSINRVFFSREEKIEALSKSKYRCSHCGKSLTKENCTVDHVVSLSRGGSNDSVNLVALCEVCNKNKGSKIVVPEEYYRYLSKAQLKAVQVYFNNYCDETSWFRSNNLFKYDKISCTANRYVISTGGRLLLAPVKVDIRKAVYSDLDEIYHFLLEYAYCYLDDGFISNLKDMMTHVFTYGCFYYTRNNGTGRISMVVQFEYGVGNNVEGNMSYLFELQIHTYVHQGISMKYSSLDFKEASIFDMHRKILVSIISDLVNGMNGISDIHGKPFIPIRLMAYGTRDMRVLELIDTCLSIKPIGYDLYKSSPGFQRQVSLGYPYLLQLGSKNAMPADINSADGFSVAAGQIFMLQTMDWRLLVKLLEDERLCDGELYASRISDKTVHIFAGHDFSLRDLIGQSKLRTLEKFEVKSISQRVVNS